MSIAQSLYTWLAANSAIDTEVDGRVFPQLIPQAIDTGLAALTFTQESAQYIEHLAGRSDTRLAEFSIDCYASTQLAARDLAETVQSELVGVRGSFGAHTAESVRLENDFDRPFEDDTGRYGVSLRFVIAYD